MDEILTTYNISKEKGVAIQTVRNWCKYGVAGVKLEHEYVGNKLRITRGQLQGFLDEVKRRKTG